MKACDLCGKNKPDVTSYQDEVNLESRVTEDKIRFYVEKITKKEIPWMPKLCDICYKEVIDDLSFLTKKG